jgi:hypothetical protein
MTLGENGSGANARSAEARRTYAVVAKPVTGLSRPVPGATYAEVAKKRSPRPRVRFESKRRKIATPLTLKQ